MPRFITLLFLCFHITAHAQNKTITGTVYDAVNNVPLPGCNVQIKGTAAAFITDINGQFTIKTTLKKFVLVFHFVGYESKQMEVSPENSPLVIKLAPKIAAQDEVVVLGYATRTKRQVVASSVSIRGSAVHSNNTPKISTKTIKAPKQRESKNATNTESYKKITENNYHVTGCEPISTFAADIDRASYSNVRRMLKDNVAPPADAVRIEEMINYFDYDYASPTGKTPYAIYTELTECPWNAKHQLMRVALKCKTQERSERVANNLVFLLDVSGSMSENDRLPLAIESFKLLIDSLSPTDKVAIVTYAGAAGLALEPTAVSEREKILTALTKLSAGGSTAGGQGIELAYKTARNHFIANGNNRVILATDGDFNVGISSEQDVTTLIEKEKQDGIFLTCLGFGNQNYKDDVMEAMADKGNGNYYYIDQLSEAKRVLQKEFSGTLNVVAKDVKLQAEFNPRFVHSYRLIGYENRLLNKEDFDDDAKDAGELGEGHTLTALYEIIPQTNDELMTDSLMPSGQQETDNCGKNLFSPESNELAVIRTRYKNPDGKKSRRQDFFVINNVVRFEWASRSTRMAASVAMLGMLLRQSSYSGTADITKVLEVAKKAAQNEFDREFVELAAVFEKLHPATNKTAAAVPVK
jgi:Ca-activated chloride channel family protein